MLEGRRVAGLFYTMVELRMLCSPGVALPAASPLPLLILRLLMLPSATVTLDGGAPPARTRSPTLSPFPPILLSARWSACLPGCKFLLPFACLARALAALCVAPALVVFARPRMAQALVVLASPMARALVLFAFSTAARAAGPLCMPDAI